MEFKDRLKEIRKQQGISQNELANRVGIHVTNISRYERGENKPTTQVLSLMANVLNTSVDFLMNGTVDENAAVSISDKELLQQFKRATLLSETDRQIVKKLIDAFLFQKEIERKLAS